ncbi:LysM peptidoglycan-binding domain-containing protein [Roseateles violae]|uniref:LysM domain-containing protein n=1 Tax=Roseateles violae TaxID=3058042 RepID=A0ABT8DSV4_9BURK|nr:LysM domain-containing protein [Pelomonas sp. PFR6]MDN3921401.1 LysM domain-containing protein [Pelomonas sp. PFR6]
MPFCDSQKKTILRGALALSLLSLALAGAQATTYPVTPEQRATAEKVAQAGVPLSELAPDAPDSHTVKPGDTLWDISKLFLKSPWRWPELWGMNREQIANPHLIYPGQLLLLVKQDGRASLQLAQNRGAGGTEGTVKLSPQVRSSAVDNSAIAAIPLTLIVPFLADAVVFDTDELATAPRIVATPENHVLLARGDKAYARGDLSQATDYRIFRNTKPLVDPATGEVLGFEAPYLGTAELVQPDQSRSLPDGKLEVVPATVQIKQVRKEIGVGDRLSPVPQRSFDRYVPHAPAQPVAGQIISIYGEALHAGQNQIVALNRGERDGMERGHVLALWKAGRYTLDRTGEKPEQMRLPDERQGILFVFQVYQRVSYALIITASDAVRPGDRFTQP